jgi:hypothetical protein
MLAIVILTISLAAIEAERSESNPTSSQEAEASVINFVFSY